MRSYSVDINLHKSHQLTYKNVPKISLNPKMSVNNHIQIENSLREKNSFYDENLFKLKLNNRTHDLKKTISLNLEILLDLYKNQIKKDNGRNNTNTSSSIIEAVNSIKVKLKRKNDILNKIKNLRNKIKEKISDNNLYHSKIKEMKKSYRHKLSKCSKLIENMDSYTIDLNKKYYYFWFYFF